MGGRPWGSGLSFVEQPPAGTYAEQQLSRVRCIVRLCRMRPKVCSLGCALISGAQGFDPSGFLLIRKNEMHPGSPPPEERPELPECFRNADARQTWVDAIIVETSNGE
jgi:hypothetical protein